MLPAYAGNAIVAVFAAIGMWISRASVGGGGGGGVRERERERERDQPLGVAERTRLVRVPTVWVTRVNRSPDPAAVRVLPTHCLVVGRSRGEKGGEDLGLDEVVSAAALRRGSCKRGRGDRETKGCRREFHLIVQ